MNVRRVLLKTMLGALGLGAAAGVAAILMGGDDVVVRVMATAFVTAGAALLMIPASFLIDRRRTQGSGLLLMAAIVVEYVVWMLFTWLVDTAVPYGLDERLGFSGLWLLAGILPAAVSVRLTASPRARVAGWCGAAVCAAAFLCLMLGTWLPAPWPYSDEDWGMSAVAVFAFGALATACVVSPGEGLRYAWRWLGVPAAMAGLGMALVGIWLGPHTSAIPFAIVTGATVVLGHANLMLLVVLRPGQRWVRAFTIAAMIATALLFTVMVVLAERERFPAEAELVARLAGAAGILACSGSLAILVLARLNRRAEFAPAGGAPLEITVICPRCRRKTRVALGEGSCAACGLRIEVRIEEPRCTECGYLLYKLTSAACPECGAPVRPGAARAAGLSREAEAPGQSSS